VKRGYLLVAAVIAAALLISVALLNTTKEDFSIYNGDWNGASHAKELVAAEGYGTRELFALSEAGSSGSGVLFMLNPNKTVAITDADTRTLQSFVQNGGSLVIANDFGNANVVLSGMGVANQARFSGSLLSDNVSKGVDEAHPLVTDISASALTAGVQTLYFNYGTTLDIGASNVTVLARSAPTSYLRAAGGDNALIAGSKGAHPVLATLPYGKGRIVLLSDPSVFINGMLGQADNQKLLSALIANLTGGNTAVPVLFDESHQASPPVWSLLYDRVNADDNVKYTIILLSIAVFVIGINATALARRRRTVAPAAAPVSEEAAIADVIGAHPRWRRSRIKSILKQLHQRRRATHDDRK
jgi:Domain of unknown function (DUF4350)